MSAQSHVKLTPEEYLAIDRAAEVRSEYYRGEMFAMSGGAKRHNRLIGRTYSALDPIVQRKGCEVYTSDMRLRCPGGLYTYPDVMVVCDEPDSVDDDFEDIVDNPILIVEVLSKSTEAHDRGFKLEHYRTIMSLQEYVLISQRKPHVEVYRRRTDSDWLYTAYRGTDASCRLDSLDCEIALASIYRGVRFADVSSEPRA